MTFLNFEVGDTKTLSGGIREGDANEKSDNPGDTWLRQWRAKPVFFALFYTEWIRDPSFTLFGAVAEFERGTILGTVGLQ